MIELKNIEKTYQKGIHHTEVLRGVNLTLPDRGLICILGASGCGKTTFLNILGGLDSPTSGTMTVDGRDFASFREEERNAYRNQKIGFVFQHSHLIECLNVLENVAIKAQISGEKECEERAHRVLKRVGVAHLEPKKPSMISGGEAQRVALARAIVNEPDVILADEPTGALDSKAGRGIMQLLREFANEHLVLVVTHNAALAEEYADRILSMEDGIFVEDRILRASENILPVSTKKKCKVGLRFLHTARLAFRDFCHNGLRSALVSAACSIGVFGLAITLTLFGWFHVFLSTMETTMLYAFPVSAGGALNLTTILDKYINPDVSNGGNSGVQVQTLVAEVYKQLNGTKELSPQYVEYVEQMPSSLYSRVEYDYGVDWSVNLFTTLNVGGVDYTASAAYLINLAIPQTELAKTALSMVGYLKEMPDSDDAIFDNYELLAGSMPANEREMLLVLNDDGSTYDYVLALLGFYSLTEIEEYLRGDTTVFDRELDYTKVLEKSYSFFNDDLVYTKNERSGLFEQNTFFSQSVRPLTVTEQEGINLKISGIVRSKLPYAQMAIKTGLYYTHSAAQKMRLQAKASAIVQSMQEEYANTKRYVNPYTGAEIAENVWEDILRKLGGGNTPVMLNVFPIDRSAKTAVIEYLHAWNESREKEEQVEYQDVGESVMQMISGIADPAKFTLLTLSGLSILIAGGMSGIVSLMSVRERQKEIGILRCMGAKNSKIALAFCLESGGCGLLSGLLGVGLSYLVSAIFFLHNGLIAVWLPIGYALLCVFALFVLNMLFAALASLSLVRFHSAHALMQE